MSPLWPSEEKELRLRGAAVLAIKTGIEDVASIPYQPSKDRLDSLTKLLLTSHGGNKAALEELAQLKRDLRLPPDFPNAALGRYFKDHTLEIRHEYTVSSVCAIDATRIASAGWDRIVCVWDLTTDPEPSVHRVLRGHENSVTSVCAIDANRLASAAQNRTVRIWYIGA